MSTTYPSTPLCAAALTLALTLLLGGCAARAGHPASDERARLGADAEQQVRTLNDRLSAAVLARDTVAMGAILGPDYVFISSAGGMGDRTSMLAGYAAGALRYSVYHADSVRVRLFGDAAVVTSVIVREGSSNGGNLSGRFRSTRVYVRRTDGWKLASAHESRIGAPAAAR